MVSRVARTVSAERFVSIIIQYKRNMRVTSTEHYDVNRNKLGAAQRKALNYRSVKDTGEAT